MAEAWSAETAVPRSLLEAFRVGVPGDCPGLVRVRVWIDWAGRCGVSYSTPAGHQWGEEGREAAERALRNFFPPNRLREWREIWGERGVGEPDPLTDGASRGSARPPAKKSGG